MLSAIGSLFAGSGSTLSLVSAGLDLLGGFADNQSYKKSASQTLAIADREARQSLLAGQLDAERIVAAGRRDIGTAIARSGASGLQMRGSVMDLIASSYANLEMDRLNTLYNAQRDADLIRERARSQASQYKAAGKTSLTRSLGSSAMTLAKSGLFSSTEGIG